MKRCTELVAQAMIAACVSAAVLPGRAEAATEAEGNAGAAKLISAGQPMGTLNESIRNEVNGAIARGLDWLAGLQKEDGSWSDPNFPALTALPMQAFALGTHPRKAEIVEKAVTFILRCVQPDGGIYRQVEGRKGGGLANYNTAICMVALHATGDKKLTPVILNARKFVASSQHLGGDDYRGGFGYDRETGRPYTDLANTYYSVVAMRETASVEDLRPKNEPRVDINWAETVKYLERLQNKPEGGPDDAGGFFYSPGESKAGTVTNKAGVVVFRSYGSMTYSGLLALIYANVDRDDMRVRSAFDWACRHWTLEENPGVGLDGLYYFYNVLTKSLNVYGADAIKLTDGRVLNWRGEMAKKLVSLQKIDPRTGAGYWKNETGRWLESDPVLVTSYVLLALEML